MSGPCAIIDTAALRHNLSVVRARAPQSRVMAVIKANAYGHGIVPVARALQDADAFGVARLSEALALRERGLTQRIVLLEGVFSVDELEAAAKHSLELVVHSFEQLDVLNAWHGSPSLQAWLKIDTGMNRLGFRVDDFAAAWQQVRACRALCETTHLMTHLACADERNNLRTVQQLSAFRAIADSLAVERSVANSAGLLAWPNAQLEWVRPGLMLYGVSPFADGTAQEFDLRPAMTLMTQLIAVRDVKAGELVGYGGSWSAPKDCRIGIAAVGYGDGYPRQIGNGSPVLVDGVQCAVTGRVSMDMIAIDLTAVPKAKVDDEVTLWGCGLPVERMAECAGTIPYELICGISQRVSVEYR